MLLILNTSKITEILEFWDDKNTILSEISRGIRIRGQNSPIPSVSSQKLDLKFSNILLLLLITTTTTTTTTNDNNNNDNNAKVGSKKVDEWVDLACALHLLFSI